jgi:glycosyltransferase involved in cell wall biosynthesis
VGDYTLHLANRLALRRRLDIAVLTASKDAAQAPSEPMVFQASGDRIRIRDVWRAVRAFRPGIVHIQYPTQRPTSLWAPFFVKRILRLPVVQTWHEYSIGPGRNRWMPLLGLDALVHVRQNLPERLPALIKACLKGKTIQYIPNGRTIPVAELSVEQRVAAKAEISNGQPIVAFFGFVYPNKGAHRLFEIADAKRHHLLFIGELDPRNEYHRHILGLAGGAPWRGRVTVTGFLPAGEAGRLLALSDAIVFPFSEGVGTWSSSVNAAIGSGSFVVATTLDPAQTGYHAGRNLFLAPAGDIAALRTGLFEHLGARRKPDRTDDWESIAQAHERLYSRIA